MKSVIIFAALVVKTSAKYLACVTVQHLCHQWSAQSARVQEHMNPSRPLVIFGRDLFGSARLWPWIVFFTSGLQLSGAVTSVVHLSLVFGAPVDIRLHTSCVSPARCRSGQVAVGIHNPLYALVARTPPHMKSRPYGGVPFFWSELYDPDRVVLGPLCWQYVPAVAPICR